MRIGTNGQQTATFIAAISGTTPSGPTEPVIINAAGKLGTASATKAAGLSAAAGRRLLDALDVQQRVNERLQRQIDRLRKQVRNGS